MITTALTRITAEYTCYIAHKKGRRGDGLKHKQRAGGEIPAKDDMQTQHTITPSEAQERLDRLQDLYLSRDPLPYFWDQLYLAQIQQLKILGDCGNNV